MATNEVFRPGEDLSLVVTNPAAPNSSDPVRMGTLSGVAQTDERADGTTSVAVGTGVWEINVDDNVGGGIALYDPLYYHDIQTGLPLTSVNNTAAAADAFYGYALEVVAAAATTVIRVLVVNQEL